LSWKLTGCAACMHTCVHNDSGKNSQSIKKDNRNADYWEATSLYLASYVA